MGPVDLYLSLVIDRCSRGAVGKWGSQGSVLELQSLEAKNHKLLLKEGSLLHFCYCTQGFPLGVCGALGTHTQRGFFPTLVLPYSRDQDGTWAQTRRGQMASPALEGALSEFWICHFPSRSAPVPTSKGPQSDSSSSLHLLLLSRHSAPE